MSEPRVPLKLLGREAPLRLPPLLQQSAGRSADRPDDPFLPPGFLVPTSTYDVGTAARSTAGGVAEKEHVAEPDEIVVLELADGSTYIGSASRLRETLAQTHPELVGGGGEILVEKLRAEGAAPRGFLGEATGGLVSKVYTLAVRRLEKAGGDEIIASALEALGRLKPSGEARGGLAAIAELGVSWLGTKALMAAIENKLAPPGLYRWSGAADLAKEERADFEKKPLADPKSPLLVFVHGTGSNTVGSFGDLLAGGELWGTLARRFGDNVYAFEHRTLSQSPIENALELVAALPEQAHVSLVSHSRGGLVADLLCLGNFDSLIGDYRYAFEGTGDASKAESERVKRELGQAHAEQRDQLQRLAAALRAKRIVVQRYVRTASPAQGTKLASGNFDLFLSALLTLVGQVPFFFGNPVYSALKRVVIEIARNRTNPHLVPGIEAMLPDSPMARLLHDAPVREGIAMAVIAGDIQGGNLLTRLGVLLTDFLFFDSVDNDLVVDTAAMLAGVAPAADARVLFDRGAEVSHFRYFANVDTRNALRDWLVCPKPLALEIFRPLPKHHGELEALALSRAVAEAPGDDRPIVVVLPGVMGSHLRAEGDRVWFDLPDLVEGGLSRIAWERPGVEAEDVWERYYGAVCTYLAASHRVRRYAYDWRQPLDVLGERFGEFLDRLLKETKQPIRLLAHSMGGLVVRACIHKRRSVMDSLMRRPGARFVMLGTPNQGSHSMVENLLGKGSTLRTLIRLDVHNDMRRVLDIVAGFRGALQLLPKPGFTDSFQGQPGGGGHYDFQSSETWRALQAKVTDLWFGDGRSAVPEQAVLDAANWLWARDGSPTPALPAEYAKSTVYVFGVARNTPCGLRENESGRLKMVGTTRGDGTVTWDSGRIFGIGSYYYMPAEHGDLPAATEHFPALAELLTAGATARLAANPPAVRAIEQPRPVSYDAGPPTADDADAIERGLMGASLRERVVARAKRRLEVAVKAMDLRFLSEPIMVGHFELDPIAGPEGLIDRELLEGDLSERHALGLYAGPRGSASVVLRAPNEAERQRGSLSGAVVTGLGSYDSPLSLADLAESVRTGVMRYLLQVVDVLGESPREVPLATLLIGYNSSANLTVGASVEALVRGVVEANARFQQTTRLDIRVAKLDIVELYLDTAITAVYELRQMADKLRADAERQDTLLVCRSELEQGDGVRQRLFDNANPSYWPRLIVTDADRGDEASSDRVERRAPLDAAGDAAAKRMRAPLAERLRFLYVGQRARAESVVQQRQPGLIEMLVRQQIHTSVWQEDFGRMLFQLMVPHDFKDAARQLERVVLVVDAYTANLPWELMLADDPARCDDKRPLAVRTSVIRQLSSSRFRRQVRQAIGRTALVVGNPSLEGFAEAFPAPPGCAAPGVPQPLPGAQAEAEAVSGVLRGLGYTVEQEIGEECRASDVFAKLYRRPYRIVHISAHGVFDLPHADGRRRSGVVLSDGLLLSAAEIGAMETVPDLVFLNCCHLGQVDGANRDGNRLAASVSRELIDIGVRCVVVAGWAVDDRYAQLFGETFYRQLLLDRRAFGDAVFEARKAVWNENPQDITWGAFQAYGDVGWLAEPRADGAAASRADHPYVTPEELLDELASLRAELSRRNELQTERERVAQVARIEQLLNVRCPPAWLALPALQSALGATWYDLGRFEQARAAYLLAVQAEDKLGRVPIRDIEQLANVEARLGEQRAEEELLAATRKAKGEPETDVDSSAPGARRESGLALINLARKRLDGLDQLVSAAPDSRPEAAAMAAAPLQVLNAGRSALRGSAYKRLAGLYARRVLATPPDKAAYRGMRDALLKSVRAYREAEGTPGDSRFMPYSAINRLALDSLTPWGTGSSARDAAIALAQQCRQAAVQSYARSPNLWDAVIQPEALLVERLIDGSLGAPAEAGRAAYAEVERAYEDALANVTIKPSQIDSIVSHMELLSRFYDAKSFAAPDGEADRAALRRTADRLLELVQHVRPGRAPRGDRPRSSERRARSRPPRPGRTAAADETAPSAPVDAARKAPGRKRAPRKS